MQIVSIIAVYFIVWWVCLFMILPIGARSQRDAGDVVRGSEPGAPALFRAWPKILATTVLAAVLTGLLLWSLTLPFFAAYLR